ncbi:uncharacterized protein N7459_005642 [Penicillium hispanicum]|uniref:uncharacterized protein n=1 Tax=Penicillium hispanicum TaxID=1080232 RepID=UPI002541AE03|nr:uncharacterized protein N7459_005642 [Penicillium hispanicum]KAJ5579657.1 hypothetical protein N7459_005642 [Penicillium hispanicum]
MGFPNVSLAARPLIRPLGLGKVKWLALSLAAVSLFWTLFHSRSLFMGVITQATTFGIDNGNPDYWTWETKSPFHDASRDPSSLVDEKCDSFPSELLSRVQVVLKIGSTESKTRVQTHLASVTRCISNLLIVSDLETELNGHRVHDVLADLPASARDNIIDFEAYNAIHDGASDVPGGEGWRLDRFKFLPMVERAKTANPTADWFVFLETDTYMVWDNLFRFLAKFNPSTPMYMGSPSPGFALENEERVWFAYGGAGFVLSRGAINILTERKKNRKGEFLEPSLSEKYMDVVATDCCGDSVLGYALHQKGVSLTGLWPMFNAHALHSIPFDEVHWCQPVISLHKSLLSDMTGLAKWESQRDRKEPLLYADLMEYLGLGQLDVLPRWDNADWGGYINPPESPAHQSLAACRQACHESDTCLSFTYDSGGSCAFGRGIRLGGAKTDPNTLSAGWDNEKIMAWKSAHRCEKPIWVKPSVTRIF